MNRHEYNNCNACHADPSGGGLLTAYGRAQSVLLLSSRYGKRASEEEEPGRYKDFLFGVPTPSQLLLGGWFRGADIASYSLSTPQAPGGSNQRYLLMRADLQAQLKVGIFRANGSLGFATADSKSYSKFARVTNSPDGANLVSREHWLGVDLADEAVLLRAGRINRPFGLRNIEHTSWVRSETFTDFNQSQEHGVAVSYNTENIRAEVMGIAGNYQVNPDDYRNRGYSGYFEYNFGPRYAVGASSLLTHAEADNAQATALQIPATRQAHGLFARISPWTKLSFLGEADMLVVSAKGLGTKAGYVGFVQADYEPIQGLHILGTGETVHSPAAAYSNALAGLGDTSGTGYGTWLGAWWFFLPHFDVRFDFIRRVYTDTEPTTLTYLLQFNAYL